MASRLDRLWGHRWWGDRLQGPPPDYGLGVVVALVIAVTVWLAATPLVPAVARATLARFHLRTGSFWGWAIQQPVPAMYNFANRYRVDLAEEAEHGEAEHGEAEHGATEHLGSVTTTPIRDSGGPIESGSSIISRHGCSASPTPDCGCSATGSPAGSSSFRRIAARRSKAAMS